MQKLRYVTLYTIVKPIVKTQEQNLSYRKKKQKNCFSLDFVFPTFH